MAMILGILFLLIAFALLILTLRDATENYGNDMTGPIVLMFLLIAVAGVLMILPRHLVHDYLRDTVAARAEMVDGRSRDASIVCPPLWGAETAFEKAIGRSRAEMSVHYINGDIEWAKAHATGIWWKWQTGDAPDLQPLEVDVLCQK